MAPGHLLPALLHLGSPGMSRANGACTGAGSLGGVAGSLLPWGGLGRTGATTGLGSVWDQTVCAEAELGVGIIS